MPETTRALRPYPHGAPACYLARPASVPITTLHHRPSAGRARPAGSGNTFPPERTTR